MYVFFHLYQYILLNFLCDNAKLHFFILCLVFKPIFSIRIYENNWIIYRITIGINIRIFLLQRIHTHPQTNPRLIIPRTIVVHTCLLVKFLGIKEIRGVPRIVALFYEHLTKRHVFDVLRHLAIKVGDDCSC